MKKVLIYGYYIFNNLGDNYMMYYVNELLKKNNITPYYFEQIDDSYFIINNVKRYSFPGYKKFSNKFIKLIELLKWYFISNHSDEFDALIFIGGGYTNEDFGLLRMIYMYLLINRFKKNNKKIYFTGQTVGPVNTFIGKYLLREIYSNADFIAVRERTSYEYLKNINIDNHLVGDDAFLSFEEYDSHLKKNPTTILCFKYFKGYEKFKKYFFDFCLDIAKKSKDYILIIPFRSLEKEPEYKVNYELYEYFNDVNLIFTNSDHFNFTRNGYFYFSSNCSIMSFIR